MAPSFCWCRSREVAGGMGILVASDNSVRSDALLLLVANIVPSSKALVTRSDALVTTSFLLLVANIVPSSKALVTRSDALVTTSFLLQ